MGVACATRAAKEDNTNENMPGANRRAGDVVPPAIRAGDTSRERAAWSGVQLRKSAPAHRWRTWGLTAGRGLRLPPRSLDTLIHALCVMSSRSVTAATC